MQIIPQFENLDPLRAEPGKVPLAISLRNALFDTLFYDTLDLSNEEKARLLTKAFEYDEGGMLLVHPREADEPIHYYALSHDLLEDYPELDTVTLPGVGSSAIGAAALARQVADLTGRPAVGIIAGYGAADVLSEALGGWFDFGIRNRTGAWVADWRRRLGAAPNDESLRDKFLVPSTTFLAEEPESNTLLNILLRQAPRLKLLVGHSKGALNIHNVLPEFLRQCEMQSADYEDLAIVTLGCATALPEVFRNVHQYVGGWDLLGRFNTPTHERYDPSVHTLPGRCHNLCSINPLHMPVERVLKEALRLH